MEHVFKAEVLVGKADAGHFIAVHDTPKLKFCFYAETEDKVLAKVDKALSLYVRHKLAPWAKLKATRIKSFDTIASDQQLYTREIPFEATA